MATHLTRPTNGVSFGYVHTITATDDANGWVLVDFQVDYMISAVVMALDGSDQSDQDTCDMIMTFPANGQVRIGDGSVLKLVAGATLHIIANRRSA